MTDAAEIKRRIKSVSDTRQITKAMELISVAKMHKAAAKHAAGANYFDTVRSTVKDILRHSPDIHHKYIDHRPDSRTAYIVIAGDKGLAGSYNANVLDLAWEHMQKRPVHYVVTIGQMARAFFVSKKQSVDLEFTHSVTNPTMHDARGIMRDILDLYDRNLMDEVIVAFTEMKSASALTPRLVRLLPIMERDIEVENPPSYGGQLVYDPSPAEVLNVLVPQYLVGLIYSTLTNSSASEHAARMVAMSGACKNAEKMLSSLNLEYNRSRQNAVTSELLDMASSRLR